MTFKYSYTDMKNDLELQQFWKNHEPFPPHESIDQGVYTIKGMTIKDDDEPSKPVPNQTVSERNPDPKTAKTAVRFDSGKTAWSLMPFEAVEEINKVLEFGAQKYAAHNWQRGEGFKYSRVLNSLLRHVFAWMRGEDRDPESGLSHLAHAGCNIIFLLYYEHYKNRYNLDDRHKVNEPD